MPRQVRRRSQVTVPEPYLDPGSLRAATLALKELTEVLAGQRGEALDAAVTWRDLVELGIVKPDQVPTDLGSNTR